MEEKKRRKTLYQIFFKRPIDFLGALVLLMLLSPVWIVVVILEVVFHGWPPVFKQKRVGKNRKVFWLFKFRSFSNKRDAEGNLLPDKDRITKFGKFIRKTSIDELPQLWNILVGNMSFIGPRPKDIKECVFFTERQCGRFRVRPGITGLAQVNGRNSIRFDKIAEFDNEYADRITFWGDVKIACRTIGVIFRRKAIDAEVVQGDHFCIYYNDLLLSRGEITKEEYDEGVAFSKTLKARDIMPSFCARKTTEGEEVG
jgi:lipopolysaccharide/colanic/teichoic acid biosynthesis glycosyltransferase